MTETKTFKSDMTGEHFTIRTGMNCKTENIIYLLYCNKCKNKQYIGETKNELYSRIGGHRSDIGKQSLNKCVHVVGHFNSEGHTKDDMRVIPIEQILCDDNLVRKEREKYWFRKLKTVFPNGLNEVS